MITRHVVTIPAQGGKPARRVHYRRCGTGPALLMIHQSPRSGAEYEPLMRVWGEHFTCIAPDSPGFGQSDPMPGEPGIDDFADAIAQFAAAIGVTRAAAWGFHSGGIFLVTALKRHRDLFSAIAVGGYAVWTEEESRIFGESYLAPLTPSDYGEHYTWVWNRILEQSWFFPWYDVRDEARLAVAHADLGKVHDAVMDLLASGDHYRTGYAAALGVRNDVLRPGEPSPPVLITAYDGDPLQAHMPRFGPMAENWDAHTVASAQEQQAESLAFLRQHAGDAPCGALAEDVDEGWLPIGDGLVHWRGDRGATRLSLHAPAGEATPAAGQLAIDAPGHGHSSEFADMRATVDAAANALGIQTIDWPAPPDGDPAQLYPDLTPMRFGEHLLRAWGVARAEAFFRPWYAAAAAKAVGFAHGDIACEAIGRRALARLRAGGAAARYHAMLTDIARG